MIKIKLLIFSFYMYRTKNKKRQFSICQGTKFLFHRLKNLVSKKGTEKIKSTFVPKYTK